MRQGWDRWIGGRGACVGRAGFGASGPGEALFQHFATLPEAVCEAALALL